MGLYNVRLYDYIDSTQIRVYNRPIRINDKVKPVKEIEFDKYSEKKKEVESSNVRTQQKIDRSAKSSMNRTIQSIYEVSRANEWNYFLTLTFDPKIIDNTDYDLITKKVSKWLNNLRTRYAPDLKYLLVPELHKDGKKYHFHGLLSNIGNLKLIHSGKVSVGKYIKDFKDFPNGDVIYNLENWKYGFSTVTKVKDNARVACYITKYITKELCSVTENKKRYWISKNVDRAIINNFNLDYDYIHNILLDNVEDISYSKHIPVPDAGLDILYMEVQKHAD